jgi:predicted PurR-regulated permease PerM
MKREYFLITLFFLIVAIFFYLFYKVMAPFFAPIAWSGILAIVFYPLYKRLGRKIKSPGWASFIMTIAIFVLIIGPAIYLMASLVGEAADAITSIDELYKSGELQKFMTKTTPFLDGIKKKLAAYPQVANLDFETITKNIVGTVSSAIGSKATVVIANITKTIFQFLLTIFTMFFFFRDGDKLVLYLKRLTPLDPDQVGVTYTYLTEVIEGTMYGGVVMALIQGTLGGILFAVMGIKSAVFWGAVMGFLSLLPILGPFLIYIPAGLIMLLTGSPVKGIIILVFGTVVISQIDNFIRPLLFRGKTQMHTLLVFFSLMGGMALFGLVGLVLGPFIAAVFMTILKMFELKLHPDSATTES